MEMPISPALRAPESLAPSPVMHTTCRRRRRRRREEGGKERGRRGCGEILVFVPAAGTTTTEVS